MTNLTSWNTAQFEEYMGKLKSNEDNVDNINCTINFIFPDINSANHEIMPNSIDVFSTHSDIPFKASRPNANNSNNAQRETEAVILLSQSTFQSDITDDLIYEKNGDLNLNSNYISEWCSRTMYSEDREKKNEFYSISANSSITYSRAADNLKLFLEKKKLPKNIEVPLVPGDFERNEHWKCDKSIQTFGNDIFSKSTSKNKMDKSNQTNVIRTKCRSMSTESNLTEGVISKDILQIGSTINPTINTKKQEKIKTKNSAITSKNLNYDFSKKMKKINTYNKKVQKDQLENKSYLKDLKKRLPKVEKVKDYSSHSDSDNSSNDSKLEEVTVMSNSKLLSFTLPSNNPICASNSTNSDSIINTKNTTKSIFPVSKYDEKQTSFWDDVLIPSTMENTNPASITKTKVQQQKIPLKVNSQPKTIGDYKDLSINDSTITSQSNDGELVVPSLIEYKDITSKQNRSLFDETRSSVPIVGKSKVNNTVDYLCSHPTQLDQFPSESKFVRSFYLNPYDDLVKSHLNSMDRRIKSVSAKNGCSISIEGPLNPRDSILPKALPQFKVVYRCSISSYKSENLHKCVNYLKETFPNTYLQNGLKNLLK